MSEVSTMDQWWIVWYRHHLSTLINRQTKRLEHNVKPSSDFLNKDSCEHYITVNHQSCTCNFSQKDVKYRIFPFTGRSDYGPFIDPETLIPGKVHTLCIMWYCVLIAGGLFTGADDVKTEEERQTYGGFANVALDTCYHQVSIMYILCLTRKLILGLVNTY